MFPAPQSAQASTGAHLATYSNGTGGGGAISRGLNQPRREADRALSDTDVKAEWRYDSTPPYAFIACAGTTVSLSLLILLNLMLNVAPWRMFVRLRSVLT